MNFQTLSSPHSKESRAPASESALPELSVIVLCYRSGDSVNDFVPRTIESLKQANILNYEVILVANYHTHTHAHAIDSTPARAAELASRNAAIRYTAKPKEGMMGWDMKSGLEMAKGKYIVVIDGDGQMPVEDIARVYEKIKSEQLDIVKTYRVQRGDSLWRKVISYFFNVLFKVFFPGLEAGDINSKPKILSRSAYERLRLSSNDWFIDAEIMIQARRFGFKVGEVPTVFLGLTGRRSFVRLKTVAEFIVNLIKYRLKEFIV